MGFALDAMGQRRRRPAASLCRAWRHWTDYIGATNINLKKIIPFYFETFANEKCPFFVRPENCPRRSFWVSLARTAIRQAAAGGTSYDEL